MIAKLEELKEWDAVFETKGGYSTAYWRRILDPIFDEVGIHKDDRESVGSFAIGRARRACKVFRRRRSEENKERENEPISEEEKPIFNEGQIEKMKRETHKIARQEALVDTALAGEIPGEAIDKHPYYKRIRKIQKDVPPDNAPEFKFR